MGENSTENQKRKLENFFKTQKEKLDEMEEMKKTNRTLQEEIFKLKKELNLLSKESKMKQKVNFILNTKNESLQTKITKLREEASNLKKLKSNLEKELKKSLKGKEQHKISSKDDSKEELEHTKENNSDAMDYDQKYKDEVCLDSQSFDNDTSTQNKVEVVQPVDIMEKKEKIKNLVPVEHFFSPMIPFVISFGLVDKYVSIFGDHACESCEKIEHLDQITNNLFQFTICKKFYISMYAINSFLGNMKESEPDILIEPLQKEEEKVVELIHDEEQKSN